MHESFDLSDPELRETAAGEYALGTLTRSERAAFESLLSVSHDLQRDVERWREHLNVFNEQLPLSRRPPMSGKASLRRRAPPGSRGGVAWACGKA
ncbi:hypothetical protein ACU8V3_16120 [Cobetia marina]